MKIDRVAVTYGELRSAGYPSFSNKRHEVTLGAMIEPGETARGVEQRLMEIAKREVKAAFGDVAEKTEMDLPF